MNKDLRTYYTLKPFIPRTAQIWLRRKFAQRRLQSPKIRQCWPILENACQPPADWFGWPGDREFALVLTHDVERSKGLTASKQLAELERELGFCSSFNFVPERYQVPEDLRTWLTEHGFEVGVHGLNHDGKLYASEEEFATRAVAINRYLDQWNSVGFRSPAMHHNLEWIGQLDIEYDLSTFDTDPFEPQSEGVETIFPFLVDRNSGEEPYVEMPYTLPQDHALFVILQEQTIDIWKRKVDWVAKHGGMVLVNIHPDYICFSGEPQNEEYSIELYSELLTYIETQYSGRYWNALPRNVAEYWRMANAERAQHRLSVEHPSHRNHIFQADLDEYTGDSNGQSDANQTRSNQTTVSA